MTVLPPPIHYPCFPSCNMIEPICKPHDPAANEVSATCIFNMAKAETDYLKKKDARLGALIDQIGPIRRETDPDLFSAVVHHIVGQQISTKAQTTIWNRMREALGTVDAKTVISAGSARRNISSILPARSKMARLIWNRSGICRMRRRSPRFLPSGGSAHGPRK